MSESQKALHNYQTSEHKKKYVMPELPPPPKLIAEVTIPDTITFSEFACLYDRNYYTGNKLDIYDKNTIHGANPKIKQLYNRYRSSLPEHESILGKLSGHSFQIFENKRAVRDFYVVESYPVDSKPSLADINLEKVSYLNQKLLKSAYLDRHPTEMVIRSCSQILPEEEIGLMTSLFGEESKLATTSDAIVKKITTPIKKAFGSSTPDKAIIKDKLRKTSIFSMTIRPKQ